MTFFIRLNFTNTGHSVYSGPRMVKNLRWKKFTMATILMRKYGKCFANSISSGNSISQHLVLLFPFNDQRQSETCHISEANYVIKDKTTYLQFEILMALLTLVFRTKFISAAMNELNDFVDKYDRQTLSFETVEISVEKKTNLFWINGFLSVLH